MTKNGWRSLVMRAQDDPERTELLAELLFQQDFAKSALLGFFGYTGMPWPELVGEIFSYVRRSSKAPRRYVSGEIPEGQEQSFSSSTALAWESA